MHGHIKLPVKMHYFFKNPILGHGSNKLRYRIIMSKEGSNKIINQMTPGSGVLMIGCGHIGPKVPNGLFH